MGFWRKDQDLKSIQAIIDLLLSLKKGDGWPVSAQFMMARAALLYSSQPPLNGRLMIDTLKQMDTGGLKTINDFEKLYVEQRKNKSKVKNLWEIYIPLDINVKDDVLVPLDIKSLGRGFKLLRLKDIFSERISLIRQQLKEIDLGNSEYRQIDQIFLVVEARGPSWQDAWKEVEPAFNTLRGMIELTFLMFRWRISFREKPRHKIPHPKIGVAINQSINKSAGFIFSANKYDGSRDTLTRKDFDRLFRDISIIEDLPNKDNSLSIAFDGLRLYAQAMDENLDYACFMGLWQMLETLTISEATGGKTDEVINRVVNLVGRDTFGCEYKMVLKTFAEKRNDIVHRGIHNIVEDDVNNLKTISKLALNEFVKLARVLPTTQHIRQYFSYRERGASELSVLSETIQYIEDQRNSAGSRMNE